MVVKCQYEMDSNDDYQKCSLEYDNCIGYGVCECYLPAERSE